MKQKGEQRHLTVMFSDLSNSTQLGELMPPKDYSDLMQSLRSIFRDVVVRRQGKIARIQGDGLLAVFGIVSASENDTKSAIYAAAEIHQRIKKLPMPVKDWQLTMHSGIHCGPVYLNEGDLETGRFDVLGTVPNIAAKLASSAKRDSILISESALGPMQSKYGSEESTFVEFAGAKPIVSRYIVNLDGLEALGIGPTNRYQTPLVGRERQLARVLEFVDEKSPNKFNRIELIGPSGMGKTRLLDEFSRRAQLRGTLVLRGYCEELGARTHFQPFVHIARQIFCIEHRDDVTGIQDKVRAFMSTLSLGDEHEMTDLCDVAVSMLTGIASTSRRIRTFTDVLNVSLRGRMKGPSSLVLVIDDWQWVDDASRALALALTQPESPYKLITATRPQHYLSFEGSRSERIYLNPLDKSSVSSIVEHYFPGAGPFIESEISSNAEGIPLYLEELCKSAVADQKGFLQANWKKQSGWINHQMIARFANLAASELIVLKTAAVFGSNIPRRALNRLVGHLASTTVLERLQALDLLVISEEQGIVHFKHAVIRNAAYSMLDRHERIAIHLKIATLVSGGYLELGISDKDELLAFHYNAGEVPELAAVYSEKAAAKSAELFALDRVRSLTLDAITALESMSELTVAIRQKICELVNKLGMASVFDPIALGDGLGVFERSFHHARLTGSPYLVARCAYWLGYVSYARGQQALALEASNEALALALELGEVKLAAQVRATLGQIYLAVHDYDKALPLIETAIHAKRMSSRQGSSVAVGSAYSLACKGGLLADRGDFDQAQQCFDEALALLGDSMHQVGSSVRNWIGLAYLWQGRDEEALEMGKASARIAQNARSTQLLAMSSALEAYAGWRVQRDSTHIEKLKEVIGWIESRNDTLLSSMIYGWLVDASVDAGQTQQARYFGARLLRRARQNDRTGEALGCRALARISTKPLLAQRYIRWAQRSAQIRQSSHEEAKNLKLLASIS